jgi:hypothetical protein
VTFGRPTLAQRQEQRAREKTANLQALATIPAHKLHRGSYEGTTGGQSPKEASPCAAKPTRRLVAALPCAMLRHRGLRAGVAHPNFGKGMATKARSDVGVCLACLAAGPRPGEVGCHARFDQSGYMTKDERRAFEKLAATLTQKLIVSRGLWPANLEGAPT